jgi:hypothetical protein
MVSYGMVIQPKKKLFLYHTSSILLGVLMGVGSLFNNISRASYINEYPYGKEEGYYPILGIAPTLRLYPTLKNLNLIFLLFIYRNSYIISLIGP